jgi:phosphoglycolate phosphatase-like HAD superfamily hydrolase
LAEAGDLAIGLLTGNYRETGRLKLSRAGLDPDGFKPCIWGDQAKTRPGLVRLALDRSKALDPRKVIVIGDTPQDVNCAKVNDCQAVAVATGSFTLEELSDAGADLALSDLRDAGPLLRLIDA